MNKIIKKLKQFSELQDMWRQRQHEQESRLSIKTILRNLLTASPMWLYRYIRLEKKFIQLLEEHGDLSHITKSAKNEFIKHELYYKYGKKLTPQQIDVIDSLLVNGFTEKEIRLLVTNNIIRKNGQISLSKAREVCFTILGGVAITTVITFFMMYVTMVSVSPIVLSYKFSIISLSVLMMAYIVFVFAYFSIFPQKTIQHLELFLIKASTHCE